MLKGGSRRSCGWNWLWEVGPLREHTAAWNDIITTPILLSSSNVRMLLTDLRVLDSLIEKTRPCLRGISRFWSLTSGLGLARWREGYLGWPIETSHPSCFSTGIHSAIVLDQRERELSPFRMLATTKKTSSRLLATFLWFHCTFCIFFLIFLLSITSQD